MGVPQHDLLMVWNHIYTIPEDSSEEGQQRYIALFSGLRPSKEGLKAGEPNSTDLIEVQSKSYKQR